MPKRTWLWIAAILFVVSIRCVNADDEEDEESGFSTHKFARSNAQSTSRGFLFVNGKYVPLPYVISMSEEDRLIVNGETLQFESHSERTRLSGRSDFATRGSNRGQGGRGAYSSLADRVRGWLESDSLVILSEEQRQPELYANSEVYDILQALLDKSGATVNAVPLSLRSHLPRLRSDTELMARSAELISAEAAMGELNRRSFQSVRRLDQFAFPLSLAGMLLIVFSTGQLLLKRPPEGKELNSRSDESISNTCLFVTLIVAFSVLDLIWTILASHDGSMRELNPIGRHLISNPNLLICFKACTTGLSVGILFFLRSHPRVQLAAWWMCLLLTLMTARWLVFNSLLV